MREYGQVQSTFWQSADAQAFGDQAKLLALYLLTGPHTNGIGCFLLPDGYVMADLGWSSETVSEGFAELSRYGFAYRIDRVVVIPKFLRWNPIQNPKVAVSRVAELMGLPDGEAKRRAARAMLDFGRHLTDAQSNLIDTVCHTVSKLEPDPDPTQNQNQTRAEEREKPRIEESPNPASDLLTASGSSKPKPKPEAKARSGPVTFSQWLKSIPPSSEAIPPNHHVFRYADSVGLPRRFLELEWRWFEDKYTGSRKRYTDWPGVFRKAVEGNWGRLWWIAPDGGYQLTTVGQQLARLAEKAA